MKIKFIAKCALVLLPVIAVCLYIKTEMPAFIDDEAPHYIWNRTFTNRAQEEEYDILILGDSVANAAYMPEILSSGTVNLALGGTSPVENYYILQDWLSYNPAPSDVFCSFLDYHFLNGDTFWKRSMYSHRFTLGQNLEMLKAGYLSKDTAIITDHWINDFIEYQFYLPNKYITALMNASLNQRLEMNKATIRSDMLHMGRYIAIGNTEYAAGDTVTYDTFSTGNLYDSYYRKIIELCTQNSTKVHMIRLPMPDNVSFTEQYAEQLNLYYDSLQKQYDNVTFNWYQESYEKRYFADGTHMNTHGALRFSTFLKEQYPNLFDSMECSDTQIKAINDDIQNENRVEEFFKWIEGRDYTILLYDGTGKLEELYPIYLQYKDLKLQKYTQESLNGTEKLYFVNGSREDVFPGSLTNIENGYKIHVDSQDMDWHPIMNSGIGIVVIDNYDHKVVTVKNSTFVTPDSYFAIMQ